MSGSIPSACPSGVDVDVVLGSRIVGAADFARTPGERRYALLVVSFLALVYTFNFMDRQIMSVL